MSLTVEELTFGYDQKAVLENVSFSAEDGELLAILGPNGVGKTSLFKCILGLEKKYSGKVILEDAEVRSLSPRSLAHLVASIPQVHGISFRYAVRDMVLMGTTHRISPFSVPGRAEKIAADEAMERLGISALADKEFLRLSGGEQQLVLIARALAQQAKILLMDEPTSSLDYGNQLHVLSVVRALAKEGRTVLLSTHNPQHALWYSDRVLALWQGRVLAWDRPEKVITPELIETLYGKKAVLLPTDRGPVLIPEREGFSICQPSISITPEQSDGDKKL